MFVDDLYQKSLTSAEGVKFISDHLEEWTKKLMAERAELEKMENRIAQAGDDPKKLSDCFDELLSLIERVLQLPEELEDFEESQWVYAPQPQE